MRNLSHYIDEEMALEMLICPCYSISKSLSWAMNLVLIVSKVYFNLLLLHIRSVAFCLCTPYMHICNRNSV